jgi:hypothetical protein
MKMNLNSYLLFRYLRYLGAINDQCECANSMYFGKSAGVVDTTQAWGAIVGVERYMKDRMDRIECERDDLGTLKLKMSATIQNRL